MYGKAGTAFAPAAGALPFTGLPLTWVLLSAFVLIMAGIALATMVPRHRGDARKVNNLP